MGIINSDEMISENENEYFDLINKKIETTKVSSSSIPQKKNNVEKNKPIKYWKNVILHFLDKQNKLGISWCKELYEIIKAYQFTSERKYLDSFFWQKFEIRTKPKCLNLTNSQPLSLNHINNINLQNSEDNIIMSKSSKSLNELTSSQ